MVSERSVLPEASDTTGFTSNRDIMCPDIWAERWFRITHAAVIWMYAPCGFLFCVWIMNAVKSFIYAQESNIRFCKLMLMGKANLIHGAVYTHLKTYTVTRLLNTLTIECIWFLNLFTSFKLLEHEFWKWHFQEHQVYFDSSQILLNR